MKLPTTDDAWISTLWSLDGISYREASEQIGCSPNTLSTRATRHGYRRTMGRHESSWTEGPCTQCHVVLPVEALSEDRRCDACEELGAMERPETDEEWIRALWEIDGISYVDAADMVGWTYSTIAMKAQRHGFKRTYGTRDGRWIQGPCVSCGSPQKATDLTDEHCCSNCETVAEVMDAYRESLSRDHGVDLEWERQKHRERMEERELGLRPRLPDPCVFQWPGGDRAGSRMPGAA